MTDRGLALLRCFPGLRGTRRGTRLHRTVELAEAVDASLPALVKATVEDGDWTGLEDFLLGRLFLKYFIRLVAESN